MNKKLYRSEKEKMIAGVCGGIGVRFDIDPTIVRLIWILAIFLSFGAAVIAYLLAAVVIPKEPYDIDIS